MKTIKILLFLLVVNITFAQQVITGKLFDSTTKQPVPFATVAVLDSNNTILTGAVSDVDGMFSLEVKTLNIHLSIEYLGYKTKIIDSGFNSIDNSVDLGTIYLEEDNEQLDAVVVEAEVSKTVFKLDKRVFNVGKDLSNTGVSALEVLGNVPSVNVNVDGEISLRGSQGVQILINGKPSVLASESGNALGTITSDMIESIEVITNPSAKYDAEGTSGILNIILKKEERKGVNGSVTLNTGIPDNHSLGLSFNNRSEKFNLFSQIGIGTRTRPTETEMESYDYSSNSSVLSAGEQEKTEKFLNVTLGTDYLINDYNVVTLSGNFAYEKEDEWSDANFNLYNNEALSSSYNRSQSTTANNPKYQFEAQYKKDFENDEKRSLLISATGNFFGKDQESLYTDVYSTSETDQQLSETDFKEAEYTFKLDYTHPLNEKQTIETGAQYILDDVSNDYAISNLENGEFVYDTDLSNIYDFNQNVLGVYGTYALELDKWGFKAGVRLENTSVKTLLKNTNEVNNKDYTNLFPSAHTSYKVSDNVSFQAGYSKRIYRPRLWDLNPFLNIQNTYSLSTGNPNLNPEYTDSYEVTNILKLGKLSLNSGVFYRYTDDVIEKIVSYEGNVSTTMPENVGTNKTVGFELNAKYIPAKWVTLSGDFNYNNFNREGIFEETSFNFSGDQYSVKANSKFNLPLDFDFETTFNYNSAYQTIQQEIEDTWFLDLGIRKKILKGKVMANLSVRDLFATRIRENYTMQDDFYQRNFAKQGRFVTFGISFGFGSGEAMEFSAQKRH